MVLHSTSPLLQVYDEFTHLLRKQVSRISAHMSPAAPQTTGTTMCSLRSPDALDMRALMTIAAPAAANGTADSSATCACKRVSFPYCNRTQAVLL